MLRPENTKNMANSTSGLLTIRQNNPSSESNLHYLWCAGIILLAAILRLWGYWLEPCLDRDAITYIMMARTWYDTSSFVEFGKAAGHGNALMPFYCFLIKSLMHTGSSAETAGILISIIAGSLLPLIVLGIARACRMENGMVYGSALLSAVFPPLVEISHLVLRDSLYLFLAGGSIWCILTGIRDRCSGWWAGGGLFLALAAFTRYEALELLPICMVYWGIFWKIYRKMRCHIWKAAIAFLSGFLITAVLLFLLMEIPLLYLEIYWERLLSYWWVMVENLGGI